MRKLLPLLVFCILADSFPVSSQILNGRVRSEAGGNAAGVTVRFRNRANAISTNADGTFRIRAAHLPDTLDFSAPGYEPYYVVVTEKNISDPDFEVVMLNTRSAMSDAAVKSSPGIKTEERMGSAILSGRGKAGSGSKVTGMYVSGSATAGGGFRDDKLFMADTNIGPRTGLAAKSRILTAGEVNDFLKWKMWEDYTESEFRGMGNFWGMLPNKRYTVQLTDRERNAVINEPVFLVHRESRDTVWRAITDNTGKAELWGGFFMDSTKTENYIITDRFGNMISRPAGFANGINLLTVNRSCNLSPEIDIAFVVDATGSMGDEIEFLKLELEDVIRNTMDQYSSLTVRAASVFYRDKADLYVTKHIPFHDDLLKTINFIKLQSAGGGGDTPEAVDDALATALDSLHWNPGARTRLLFLVLDAPPHNEAKERIRQQVMKAAAMGIRIVPIACSGTDKSTEYLLRTMALATNGTYAFLTNHSAVGNSHIEPTTDKYEVELLGKLMQRIIAQNSTALDCRPGSDKTVQQPVKQPGNVLSVKLYPNPSSGLFTIESRKEIKELFITDFTGKILMRLAVPEKKGRWQVDLSRYPQGTYLVKYITADNKWGAEKVVLLR